MREIFSLSSICKIFFSVSFLILVSAHCSISRNMGWPFSLLPNPPTLLLYYCHFRGKAVLTPTRPLRHPPITTQPSDPPSGTPPGVPAGHSWAPQQQWADDRSVQPHQTTPAGELSNGGSGLRPTSPDTHDWQPSWCRWRPGPPSSGCWAPSGSLCCPLPQERKSTVKDNSSHKSSSQLQVTLSFPLPTLAGNNPAFN